MFEIVLTLGMLGWISILGGGAYAISKASKKNKTKIVAGLISISIVLVGTLITLTTVIEPTIIGLKHNPQQSTVSDNSVISQGNKTIVSNNSNENNSQDFDTVFINILTQPIVIFTLAISIIIFFGKWAYKRI